jgi:hypothetical protein
VSIHHAVSTKEGQASFSVAATVQAESGSGTSPSGESNAEIDLAITPERVAELQRQVERTAMQIQDAKSSIAQCEIDLLKAKQREIALPSEMDRLQSSIASRTDSIRASEAELAEARENLSAFRVAIVVKKERVNSEARAQAVREYQEEVARIKLARKHRNEMRSRLGALPEDQSEVQHESQQRQAAEKAVGARYMTAIRSGYGKIELEHRALTELLADAERELLADRRQLLVDTASLQERNAELAACRESIALLPVRIDQQHRELAEVSSKKQSLDNDVDAARAALARKAEYLAQRQQADQTARHVVATPAPAASHVSAVESTKSNDSLATSYSSTLSTTFKASQPHRGYYNYYYRPPVGDHRVRAYTRSDGTPVESHRRTNRDDSFWNNWSSYGNANPYTGRIGNRRPPIYYGGG